MSRFVAAIFAALLFAVGCTSQPSADSVATAITLTQQAEPTATPSPEPASTPTPTPSPTVAATPTPLTPASIFASLSPAVVRIQLDRVYGSGVLIEGNYILTNAHVVWPAQDATITFPGGTTLEDVPIVGTDLLADLAVLGPVETSIVPLPLVADEELAVGNPLLLIGYPGDSGREPHPTLTETIVSRIYKHPMLAMTFLQVDAPVAGGQSGGIAVTMSGDVIGLTGQRVTEAGFGIVTSAADIQLRLERLLAGPVESSRGADPMTANTRHVFAIPNNWAHMVFVVDSPAGTLLTAEVDSDNDAVVIIQDAWNIDNVVADQNIQGHEKAQLTTTTRGPHFVIVRQHDNWLGSFTLESNQRLMAYTDPDDEHVLRIGTTYEGLSDYPIDVDVFQFSLARNMTTNINVSSLLIDPFLLVESVALGVDSQVQDENSGGGLFERDAELTYQAANSGSLRVLVTDTNGQNAGGYLATVREPYSDAPTPVSPPPTATPATSAFGPMGRYESDFFPFAIAFPFNYKAPLDPADCQGFVRCWIDPKGQVGMVVTEGELERGNEQPITLDDLVADMETRAAQNGARVLGRQEIVTQTGAQAVVSLFQEQDGHYTKLLTYLLEPNLFFRVIFFYQDPAQEELIDYIFSTFEVTR